MYLRAAEVDRYGPLRDCRPACGDGLTVVSGPNEAGKTLYLEALLQLLEPAVVDVMRPAPRVTQAPTGRVLIDHGGEQFECDGATTLGDVVGIDPTHLESVFVVRDSDLQLPGGRAYYTSLIETLGDIHTTAIGTIKAALKAEGRLTDTRLNLSSDQSHHHAGTVRDDARALAVDVRAYVEAIESDGLDALDAERLSTTRELRGARAALAVQRDAAALAEHERLAAQLETFRSTGEAIAELEAFDRETLAELRTLAADLERDRADRADLESTIDEAVAAVERTEATLEELRTKRHELEQRTADVEEARSALQSFRDRSAEATGAEGRLAAARLTTIAALVGAGASGVAGAMADSLVAIGLGIGLVVVAIASGLGYLRSNRRVAAATNARDAVIQSARDAGFEVESVEAVATAIESFDRRLERHRDRAARTDQDLTNATNELEGLREEYADVAEQIEAGEDELARQLSTADVTSIEAFEANVEARAALVAEHRTARQSLVDRFGELEAGVTREPADVWGRALDGLLDGLDLDSVDADAFEEAERDRLEAEVERLSAALEDLEEQLAAHDAQLAAFDRAARELNATPFVGHAIGLEARSRAGLETLATELDGLVNHLETDAELSRKALAVFERIEDEEERKLTDLFDPDGPASRTFERLTDGRYAEVAYNPAGHELTVVRRDGRTFTPAVLSQGTTDQLYFASRVSLASQLLGNEPGFFLLDDPFLAADPDRLRRGFETLEGLVADGWQILYLTAKAEVAETMVDEFGLDHVEMDPGSIESG